MFKMDIFVYRYVGKLLILIQPFHPTFPFPHFCFWKANFHFYKIKSLRTDKKCN